MRTRARNVGELVGLEPLQQTRFTTAVSEIGRNAVQHAGEGSVTFSVEDDGDRPQRLVAEIADEGPGISDMPAILRGRLNAQGRIPLGISGSTRLVDLLRIEAPASGGTLVRLEMALPQNAPHLGAEKLAELADELVRRSPQSPLDELELQNRDLLKTLQALRDKQLELEQADERKNQFVATLAHELRNPISTMQMTLEIMRRRPDAPAAEMAQRRETMERQARQLARLVDDLMDAARVSQGKVELRKEPAELNALIAAAVEMTGGAIAAKEHAVSLQLSDAPMWVSADPQRLQQVVCNLIQNSARYTARGGRIELRLRREQGFGVIEVSDNGMGIAADVLPHIFGLFVQGDRRRPGAEGGLGVGLTLVRGLVQDHGGTVMAASAGPDLGSTFTVTLPLIPDP